MREDFPLFVKWFDATEWILAAVDRYPKSVRFTISSRISNMALDTMESIIESIYTKNRRPILDRANLNIEKLRVMFRLSFRRRYISKQQYAFVSEMLNESGRMIGGWRKAS